MKWLYELKRFKSSRHPDLLDALKLYVNYTEPALRTDTKEIMHCLDTWNSDYEDPFYVVGLYLNNELIGFSELAYFIQEKFVIVDYLVVDKEHRGNNTFYHFIEGIREFLQKENIEYNYIVGEVACYQENLEPPESSKLLIRLLKIAHFGVVKCNYYVPRVGIYDYESEMRSIMMIYSMNDTTQIKKETFFQIVKAIYFKYYQRWHNLFVNESEKNRYDKELKSLVRKMEDQLENKKVIEINGLHGLFPVNPDFNKGVAKRKGIKIVTAIFLFFISAALVGILFTLSKSIFGWDSQATSTIIVAAAGFTLFLIALLFENKSNIFSRAFIKMMDKF
jgi:hypothetical protein